MAESGGDDPVLEIRVTGDFTDFDEGIRQREQNAPRQVSLPGPATFGNETGRGGSIPPSALALYNYAQTAAAISPLNSLQNGGVSTNDRLVNSIDRLAQLLESSMTLVGQSRTGENQPLPPMAVFGLGLDQSAFPFGQGATITGVSHRGRHYGRYADIVDQFRRDFGDDGGSEYLDDGDYGFGPEPTRRRLFGTPRERLPRPRPSRNFPNEETGLARRTDLATRRAIRRPPLEGEYAGETYYDYDEIIDAESTVRSQPALPPPPTNRGGTAAAGAGGPSPININIPNGNAMAAAAAGAGGGGGMVPPIGPQWPPGQPGGPQYPWQNFPPYPPNPNPPRPPAPGPSIWNRNILPHAMFYTTMFGLYEVGRAQRASEEGEIRAAIAQDPLQLLQARTQAIQQETGGILGGITGLGLDTLAFGGWNIPSPTGVSRDLLLQEGRYRSLINTNQNIHESMDTANLNAAILRGRTAASAAQDLARWNTEERQLRERSGFLTSQLNSSTTSWRWFSKDNPLVGEYETVPLIQDAGLRSAYTTEVQGINFKIQSGRDALAFNAAERQKDLDQAALVIRNEGRDFADERTFAPPETARRSLRRRQFQDRRRFARENPELLPELDESQYQERLTLDYNIGIQEKSKDISSATSVQVMNLLAQRRPFEAANASLVGNFNAAYAAAGTDFAQQGRLVNELLAGLAKNEADRNFQTNQQMIVLNGANNSTLALLSRNPQQAQLEELHAQRDLALNGLPKDAPASVRYATEDLYRNREAAIIQSFRDQDMMIDLNIRTRSRVIQAEQDRSPAGADVARIAGSYMAEALGLFQSGHSVQAEAVQALGRQDLEVYRRNYLESFRGEQIDLYSNRIDNPRDQENPAAVTQQITQAIEELTKNFTGENSQFFDQLKQAISDLIAQ